MTDAVTEKEVETTAGLDTQSKTEDDETKKEGDDVKSLNIKIVGAELTRDTETFG